jgi:hypothetical protein
MVILIIRITALMEPMTDYVALATSALEKAKTYLSGKWIFISENENGTTLEKQTFSDISDFSCFKLETTLNKSKDELIRKVWNVTETTVKESDSDIYSWKQLEYGSNWKVCHQFNTMPFPLYTRELLFTQVRFDEGHTTWLVATSIEDHLKKGPHPYWCTRANIYMSIWGFTPLGPNRTRVSRIVHVEPGGLIPPFIVDSTVGKHVKIIENLGE